MYYSITTQFILKSKLDVWYLKISGYSMLKLTRYFMFWNQCFRSNFGNFYLIFKIWYIFKFGNRYLTLKFYICYRILKFENHCFTDCNIYCLRIGIRYLILTFNTRNLTYDMIFANQKQDHVKTCQIKRCMHMSSYEFMNCVFASFDWNLSKELYEYTSSG